MQVAESSGSSSPASSSSSEDEQQGQSSLIHPHCVSKSVLIAGVGDGTPQQPATPLQAPSPGQTGQVDDNEPAEQVHGDVGSPLATGVEQEGEGQEVEEGSQFPSTQQLFGADSS